MNRAAPDRGHPADDGWNADIADWLAGHFMEPPAVATVESYRGGLGAELLDELAQQPECAAGALLMQAALAAGGPTATFSRRLAATFNHLFEGAGGPRTVSPFESAHFGTGRLFQVPASDMARHLERARLVMAGAAARSSEDHLSVELALLAQLTRRRAWAEAAIVEHRLRSWVPGFARQVEAHDDTGFYAGATGVLAGFLAVQGGMPVMTETV